MWQKMATQLLANAEEEELMTNRRCILLVFDGESTSNMQHDVC